MRKLVTLGDIVQQGLQQAAPEVLTQVRRRRRSLARGLMQGRLEVTFPSSNR
jgi:hypothetical protein